MIDDENSRWNTEQEKQAKYFEEQDRRDLVQEEFDVHSEKLRVKKEKLLSKFGRDIKAAPISHSAFTVLETVAAEHSNLLEVSRARQLAMWILRKARDKNNLA